MTHNDTKKTRQGLPESLLSDVQLVSTVRLLIDEITMGAIVSELLPALLQI